MVEALTWLRVLFKCFEERSPRPNYSHLKTIHLKLIIGRNKGYKMIKLSEMQHIFKDSGIYSLLKDNEIVYIGRSRNVYQRVLEHIVEGKKDFDKAFATGRGSEMYMDIIEVLLIAELHPKYNVLKIDKTLFLRVLPFDCKKEISLRIDDEVSEFIKRLKGIEYEREII